MDQAIANGNYLGKSGQMVDSSHPLVFSCELFAFISSRMNFTFFKEPILAGDLLVEVHDCPWCGQIIVKIDVHVGRWDE